MSEIIYKDLSYKLNGLFFEVDNTLGFGFKEEVYSNAIKELLIREKIIYEKELYQQVIVNEKIIAKRYFDFLVDGKIVVEVKVGNYLNRSSCNQLFEYLKLKSLKLGLLVRFSSSGVRIKRILNIRN